MPDRKFRRENILRPLVSMPGARLKKTVALLVTAAFLYTTVSAPLAEANFWSDRRQQAQRLRGEGPSEPVQTASAAGPHMAAAMEITRGLPGLQANALSSSLQDRLAKSIPSDTLKPYQPLLNALSPVHGTVREVYVPSGAKADWIVVHIQDVHLNAEAQANIGRAIEGLMNAGQADAVALEGAFGAIDVERFRRFPRRESLRAAADYFLQQNEISGAAHAALTVPSAVPVVGVDEKRAYDANVEAYKTSEPLKKDYGARWTELKRDLEARKAGVFPPDLAAYDARVEAYRRGQLPLGEYVEMVAARGGNPSAGVKALLKAISMENALDFKEVERERGELLRKLVARMGREDVADLMAASVGYRTGTVRYSEFYGYLERLCRKSGVELKAYPAMNSYVEYVLLSDRIDPGSLFRELARLEESGYGALAKNAAEMDLVKESKRLGWVEKLLDFTLTPPEWMAYAKDADAARALFGKDMSTFERFYREADIRSAAITANVESLMREKGGKVCVLVTGGFHTEELEGLMRERKFPFVTYAPKITKVDAAAGSSYLSVFTREKTPLEKLFQGEKLFVSPHPMPASVLGASLPGAVAAIEAPMADGMSAAEVYGFLAKFPAKVVKAAAEMQGRVTTVTVVLADGIRMVNRYVMDNGRVVSREETVRKAFVLGAAMFGVWTGMKVLLAAVASSGAWTGVVQVAGYGLLIYLGIGFARMVHSYFRQSTWSLPVRGGEAFYSLTLLFAVGQQLLPQQAVHLIPIVVTMVAGALVLAILVFFVTGKGRVPLPFKLALLGAGSSWFPRMFLSQWVSPNGSFLGYALLAAWLFVMGYAFMSTLQVHYIFNQVKQNRQLFISVPEDEYLRRLNNMGADPDKMEKVLLGVQKIRSQLRKDLDESSVGFYLRLVISLGLVALSPSVINFILNNFFVFNGAVSVFSGLLASTPYAMSLLGFLPFSGRIISPQVELNGAQDSGPGVRTFRSFMMSFTGMFFLLNRDGWQSALADGPPDWIDSLAVAAQNALAWFALQPLERIVFAAGIVVLLVLIVALLNSLKPPASKEATLRRFAIDYIESADSAPAIYSALDPRWGPESKKRSIGLSGMEIGRYMDRLYRNAKHALWKDGQLAPLEDSTSSGHYKITQKMLAIAKGESEGTGAQNRASPLFLAPLAFLEGGAAFSSWQDGPPWQDWFQGVLDGSLVADFVASPAFPFVVLGVILVASIGAVALFLTAPAGQKDGKSVSGLRPEQSRRILAGFFSDLAKASRRPRGREDWPSIGERGGDKLFNGFSEVWQTGDKVFALLKDGDRRIAVLEITVQVTGAAYAVEIHFLDKSRPVTWMVPTGEPGLADFRAWIHKFIEKNYDGSVVRASETTGIVRQMYREIAAAGERKMRLPKGFPGDVSKFKIDVTFNGQARADLTLLSKGTEGIVLQFRDLAVAESVRKNPHFLGRLLAKFYGQEGFSPTSAVLNLWDDVSEAENSFWRTVYNALNPKRKPGDMNWTERMTDIIGRAASRSDKMSLLGVGIEESPRKAEAVYHRLMRLVGIMPRGFDPKRLETLREALRQWQEAHIHWLRGKGDSLGRPSALIYLILKSIGPMGKWMESSNRNKATVLGVALLVEIPALTFLAIHLAQAPGGMILSALVALYFALLHVILDAMVDDNQSGEKAVPLFSWSRLPDLFIRFSVVAFYMVFPYADNVGIGWMIALGLAYGNHLWVDILTVFYPNKTAARPGARNEDENLPKIREWFQALMGSDPQKYIDEEYHGNVKDSLMIRRYLRGVGSNPRGTAYLLNLPGQPEYEVTVWKDKSIRVQNVSEANDLAEFSAKQAVRFIVCRTLTDAIDMYEHDIDNLLNEELQAMTDSPGELPKYPNSLMAALAQRLVPVARYPDGSLACDIANGIKIRFARIPDGRILVQTGDEADTEFKNVMLAPAPWAVLISEGMDRVKVGERAPKDSSLPALNLDGVLEGTRVLSADAKSALKKMRSARDLFEMSGRGLRFANRSKVDGGYADLYQVGYRDDLRVLWFDDNSIKVGSYRFSEKEADIAVVRDYMQALKGARRYRVEQAPVEKYLLDLTPERISLSAQHSDGGAVYSLAGAEDGVEVRFVVVPSEQRSVVVEMRSGETENQWKSQPIWKATEKFINTLVHEEINNRVKESGLEEWVGWLASMTSPDPAPKMSWPKTASNVLKNVFVRLFWPTQYGFLMKVNENHFYVSMVANNDLVFNRWIPGQSENINDGHAEEFLRIPAEVAAKSSFFSPLLGALQVRMENTDPTPAVMDSAGLPGPNSLGYLWAVLHNKWDAELVAAGWRGMVRDMGGLAAASGAALASVVYFPGGWLAVGVLAVSYIVFSAAHALLEWMIDRKSAGGLRSPWAYIGSGARHFIATVPYLLVPIAGQFIGPSAALILIPALASHAFYDLAVSRSFGLFDEDLNIVGLPAPLQILRLTRINPAAVIPLLMFPVRTFLGETVLGVLIMNAFSSDSDRRGMAGVLSKLPVIRYLPTAWRELGFTLDGMFNASSMRRFAADERLHPRERTGIASSWAEFYRFMLGSTAAGALGGAIGFIASGVILGLPVALSAAAQAPLPAVGKFLLTLGFSFLTGHLLGHAVWNELRPWAKAEVTPNKQIQMMETVGRVLAADLYQRESLDEALRGLDQTISGILSTDGRIVDSFGQINFSHSGTVILRTEFPGREDGQAIEVSIPLVADENTVTISISNFKGERQLSRFTMEPGSVWEKMGQSVRREAAGAAAAVGEARAGIGEFLENLMAARREDGRMSLNDNYLEQVERTVPGFLKKLLEDSRHQRNFTRIEKDLESPKQLFDRFPSDEFLRNMKINIKIDPRVEDDYVLVEPEPSDRLRPERSEIDILVRSERALEDLKRFPFVVPALVAQQFLTARYSSAMYVSRPGFHPIILDLFSYVSRITGGPSSKYFAERSRLIDDPKSTHYEILGVKKDATRAEVKSAFNRLAWRVWFGPIDSPMGRNVYNFEKIQDAFDTLSDDARRKKYDESLETSPRGEEIDNEATRGAAAGAAEFLRDLVAARREIRRMSLPGDSAGQIERKFPGLTEKIKADSQQKAASLSQWLESLPSDELIGDIRVHFVVDAGVREDAVVLAPSDRDRFVQRDFDVRIHSAEVLERLDRFPFLLPALLAQQLIFNPHEAGVYVEYPQFHALTHDLFLAVAGFKGSPSGRRLMELIGILRDGRSTHYQVLDIDQGASPEEIREAFRRLAGRLWFGPLSLKPAENVFNLRRLQEAYDTLSDPAKKQAYDKDLGAAKSASDLSISLFAMAAAAFWVYIGAHQVLGFSETLSTIVAVIVGVVGTAAGLLMNEAGHAVEIWKNRGTPSLDFDRAGPFGIVVRLVMRYQGRDESPSGASGLAGNLAGVLLGLGIVVVSFFRISDPVGWFLSVAVGAAVAVGNLVFLLSSVSDWRNFRSSVGEEEYYDLSRNSPEEIHRTMAHAFLRVWEEIVKEKDRLDRHQVENNTYVQVEADILESQAVSAALTNLEMVLQGVTVEQLVEAVSIRDERDTVSISLSMGHEKEDYPVTITAIKGFTVVLVSVLGDESPENVLMIPVSPGSGLERLIAVMKLTADPSLDGGFFRGLFAAFRELPRTLPVLLSDENARAFAEGEGHVYGTGFGKTMLLDFYREFRRALVGGTVFGTIAGPILLTLYYAVTQAAWQAVLDQPISLLLSVGIGFLTGHLLGHAVWNELRPWAKAEMKRWTVEQTLQRIEFNLMTINQLLSTGFLPQLGETNIPERIAELHQDIELLAKENKLYEALKDHIRTDGQHIWVTLSKSSLMVPIAPDSSEVRFIYLSSSKLIRTDSSPLINQVANRIRGLLPEIQRTSTPSPAPAVLPGIGGLLPGFALTGAASSVFQQAGGTSIWISAVLAALLVGALAYKVAASVSKENKVMGPILGVFIFALLGFIVFGLFEFLAPGVFGVAQSFQQVTFDPVEFLVHFLVPVALAAGLAFLAAQMGKSVDNELGWPVIGIIFTAALVAFLGLFSVDWGQLWTSFLQSFSFAPSGPAVGSPWAVSGFLRTIFIGGWGIVSVIVAGAAGSKARMEKFQGSFLVPFLVALGFMAALGGAMYWMIFLSPARGAEQAAFIGLSAVFLLRRPSKTPGAQAPKEMPGLMPLLAAGAASPLVQAPPSDPMTFVYNILSSSLLAGLITLVLNMVLATDDKKWQPLKLNVAIFSVAAVALALSGTFYWIVPAMIPFFTSFIADPIGAVVRSGVSIVLAGLAAMGIRSLGNLADEKNPAFFRGLAWAVFFFVLFFTMPFWNGLREWWIGLQASWAEARAIRAAAPPLDFSGVKAFFQSLLTGVLVGATAGLITWKKRWLIGAGILGFVGGIVYSFVPNGPVYIVLGVFGIGAVLFLRTLPWGKPNSLLYLRAKASGWTGGRLAAAGVVGALLEIAVLPFVSSIIVAGLGLAGFAAFAALFAGWHVYREWRVAKDSGGLAWSFVGHFFVTALYAVVPLAPFLGSALNLTNLAAPSLNLFGFALSWAAWALAGGAHFVYDLVTMGADLRRDSRARGQREEENAILEEWAKELINSQTAPSVVVLWSNRFRDILQKRLSPLGAAGNGVSLDLNGTDSMTIILTAEGLLINYPARLNLAWRDRAELTRRLSFVIPADDILRGEFPELNPLFAVRPELKPKIGTNVALSPASTPKPVTFSVRVISTDSAADDAAILGEWMDLIRTLSQANALDMAPLEDDVRRLLKTGKWLTYKGRTEAEGKGDIYLLMVSEENFLAVQVKDNGDWVISFPVETSPGAIVASIKKSIPVPSGSVRGSRILAPLADAIDTDRRARSPVWQKHAVDPLNPLIAKTDENSLFDLADRMPQVLEAVLRRPDAVAFKQVYGKSKTADLDKLSFGLGGYRADHGLARWDPTPDVGKVMINLNSRRWDGGLTRRDLVDALAYESLVRVFSGQRILFQDFEEWFMNAANEELSRLLGQADVKTAPPAASGEALMDAPLGSDRRAPLDELARAATRALEAVSGDLGPARESIGRIVKQIRRIDVAMLANNMDLAVASAANRPIYINTLAIKDTNSRRQVLDAVAWAVLSLATSGKAKQGGAFETVFREVLSDMVEAELLGATKVDHEAYRAFLEAADVPWFYDMDSVWPILENLDLARYLLLVNRFAGKGRTAAEDGIFRNIVNFTELRAKDRQLLRKWLDQRKKNPIENKDVAAAVRFVDALFGHVVEDKGDDIVFRGADGQTYTSQEILRADVVNGGWKAATRWDGSNFNLQISPVPAPAAPAVAESPELRSWLEFIKEKRYTGSPASSAGQAVAKVLKEPGRLTYRDSVKGEYDAFVLRLNATESVEIRLTQNGDIIMVSPMFGEEGKRTITKDQLNLPLFSRLSENLWLPMDRTFVNPANSLLYLAALALNRAGIARFTPGQLAAIGVAGMVLEAAALSVLSPLALTSMLGTVILVSGIAVYRFLHVWVDGLARGDERIRGPTGSGFFSLLPLFLYPLLASLFTAVFQNPYAGVFIAAVIHGVYDAGATGGFGLAATRSARKEHIEQRPDFSIMATSVAAHAIVLSHLKELRDKGLLPPDIRTPDYWKGVFDNAGRPDAYYRGLLLAEEALTPGFIALHRQEPSTVNGLLTSAIDVLETPKEVLPASVVADLGIPVEFYGLGEALKEFQQGLRIAGGGHQAKDTVLAMFERRIRAGLSMGAIERETLLSTLTTANKDLIAAGYLFRQFPFDGPDRSLILYKIEGTQAFEIGGPAYFKVYSVNQMPLYASPRFSTPLAGELSPSGDYGVVFLDAIEARDHDVVERALTGYLPFTAGDEQTSPWMVGVMAAVAQGLIRKAFLDMPPTNRVGLEEEAVAHQLLERARRLRERGGLSQGERAAELETQLAYLNSLAGAMEPLHVLAYLLESAAIGRSEAAWTVLGRLVGFPSMEKRKIAEAFASPVFQADRLKDTARRAYMEAEQEWRKANERILKQAPVSSGASWVPWSGFYTRGLAFAVEYLVPLAVAYGARALGVGQVALVFTAVFWLPHFVAPFKRALNEGKGFGAAVQAGVVQGLLRPEVLLVVAFTLVAGTDLFTNWESLSLLQNALVAAEVMGLHAFVNYTLDRKVEGEMRQVAKSMTRQLHISKDYGLTPDYIAKTVEKILGAPDPLFKGARGAHWDKTRFLNILIKEAHLGRRGSVNSAFDRHLEISNVQVRTATEEIRTPAMAAVVTKNEDIRNVVDMALLHLKFNREEERRGFDGRAYLLIEVADRKLEAAVKKVLENEGLLGEVFLNIKVNPEVARTMVPLQALEGDLRAFLAEKGISEPTPKTVSAAVAIAPGVDVDVSGLKNDSLLYNAVLLILDAMNSRTFSLKEFENLKKAAELVAQAA